MMKTNFTEQENSEFIQSEIREDDIQRRIDEERYYDQFNYKGTLREGEEF